MSIGGALAAARSQAGLTIDEVSERTRIRRALIRAIEQDDYSPCGGDFYVRGHIRAIARVVGADPVPLIDEYDVAHGVHPRGTVRIAGSASGRSDAADGMRPTGITAAEAFRPVMPLQIGRSRRLSAQTWVLVVVVAVLIAVVAYVLAQGPGAA